jgi:hypothetical protein
MPRRCRKLGASTTRTATSCRPSSPICRWSPPAFPARSPTRWSGIGPRTTRAVPTSSRRRSRRCCATWPGPSTRSPPRSPPWWSKRRCASQPSRPRKRASPHRRPRRHRLSRFSSGVSSCRSVLSVPPSSHRSHMQVPRQQRQVAITSTYSMTPRRSTGALRHADPYGTGRRHGVATVRRAAWGRSSIVRQRRMPSRSACTSGVPCSASTGYALATSVTIKSCEARKVAAAAQATHRYSLTTPARTQVRKSPRALTSRTAQRCRWSSGGCWPQEQDSWTCTRSPKAFPASGIAPPAHREHPRQPPMSIRVRRSSSPSAAGGACVAAACALARCSAALTGVATPCRRPSRTISPLR